MAALPAPSPASAGSAPAGAAALPAPLTSVVGREREVAAVRARLLEPGVRLLTLTGLGGVGKTRLALEAARAADGAFPDGVRFVSLAALADSSLVPAALARALGVRETLGQPLLETVQAALRDVALLLVLDNCEHLPEAAPLVAALLAACPRLTVLATSRAPLQVTGEHAWPVLPLPLPEPEPGPVRAPGAAERLARNEAVRLFVERARAVQPDFAVTDGTAATVAALCRRLDGLPLALELAAARIRALPLEALEQILARRLPLLTGGPRDAPARQRTLRATLDWSHDLLPAAERALLRRLAVFAGGCTLAAAEAVCTADGADPLDGGPAAADGGAAPAAAAAALVDRLDTLVAHSLLQPAEPARAAPRFAMRETVREYALERLEQSGEAGAVRGRHAAY